MDSSDNVQACGKENFLKESYCGPKKMENIGMALATIASVGLIVGIIVTAGVAWGGRLPAGDYMFWKIAGGIGLGFTALGLMGVAMAGSKREEACGCLTLGVLTLGAGLCAVGVTTQGGACGSHTCWDEISITCPHSNPYIQACY